MASASRNTNRKNYVAYIHCDIPDGDILVNVMDVETHEQILDLWQRIPAKDAKQFVNNIPSKFANFKSIILSVYEFQSEDYKNNLEFRQAVQAKLQLVNVRYIFINDATMISIVPIYAADITVNVGENVVTATLRNSCFEVLNCEYYRNGYLLSEAQSIPYNTNDDVKHIREKLTAEFNPKELIIVADGDDLKKLEKMSDAHFVTCSCWTLAECTLQIMTDYSKWLLDQYSVKTLMLPTINNPYILKKFLGDKSHGEVLVSYEKQTVPFTKTLLLPKSKFVYAVICVDPYLQEPLIVFSVAQCENNGNLLVINATTFPKPVVEQIPKDKKYHGIKFTVEIDGNNFPSFTLQPMILKGIRTLPQTLDDKKAEIPVIGFYGNLSVICVRKNDAKYGFLEEWGGMYGSELFISFDEEKPKYGETASTMIETKPTFVVYGNTFDNCYNKDYGIFADLLKILSMPPTEIDIDKTWHFTITKDSENPVLIEFDNFDGPRKAASPQLLMALLLKQHLKAIKNELGKKPEKVEFCFFKVDDSVKERLKNQMFESFELLKIEHQFIDI